jgi:hypothetical protein
LILAETLILHHQLSYDKVLRGLQSFPSTSPSTSLIWAEALILHHQLSFDKVFLALQS